MATNKETRAVAGCLDFIWTLASTVALALFMVILLAGSLRILHAYNPAVPAPTFWETAWLLATFFWIRRSGTE